MLNPTLPEAVGNVRSCPGPFAAGQGVGGPIAVSKQTIRSGATIGPWTALYGSTMRLRIAYRTSAAGEKRLSLQMMVARCVSTVLILMSKRPAICLLV
jgi:hypothetical protein